MKRDKGSRVGAVLSADDNEVRFFGFGVYAGRFVPPKDCGGMGSLLHDAGVENPRIDLDNGSSVYGCECWWGSEDEVRENFFDGRKIVEVNINDVRGQSPPSGS